MQKILTREDVLSYSRRNLKTIEVDEEPVLTDLAKDALREFGIKIVMKSKPEGASMEVSPGIGAIAASEKVSPYAGAATAIAESPLSAEARTLTVPTLDKKPFKEVIFSGKKITGTFIGTPHPVMTEFVGHLGFDFVCIDAEHNAIHYETVQKMLQGIQTTPTYGMVRVPMISYEYVTGALDIGADALLVPQIRTMEDIEKLRSYSLYPPEGRRGCGPSRLWDYGDSIGQLALDGDINATTNIVAQIETVQSIENLEKIAKSDFIDMFFIGPGDLSMDMGIFGQFENPKLTDTIMCVREVTKREGKRLGIFAATFEAAEKWYEEGFDMCIVNSELALLSSAVESGLNKLHKNLGGNL